MIKLKTITLLLALVVQSSAQSFDDCESYALSHSDLSYSTSVLNVFNNPANLHNSSDLSFGIFYSPSPFGLTELSVKAAALKYCSTLGTVAFGYKHYGFELYKEQNYAISYANCINKKIYIGISAIYYNVSIKNYGSDETLYFNVGLNYRVIEDLNIACLIMNPTRARFKGYSNFVPVTIKLGADYKINDYFTACCSIYKEDNFKANVNLGIASEIAEFVKICFGFRTLPESFSGGITFSQFNTALSYSVFTHTDLGLTHQFGCTLNL